MKGVVALLLLIAGVSAARVCAAEPGADSHRDPGSHPEPGSPREPGSHPEPGSQAAGDDASMDRRIEAIISREPAVEEVRAAAVRYAGLAPGRAGGWARRSRLAGLAPELTARALRAIGRDEGVKLTGGEPDYQKIDAGDDLILEVRATWNLSRLVFDGAELRAAREGARQAAQRRQLETEVTRLYYERRRGQIEWILEPPSGAAERARRTIEMEELTAQLDALTGGYLSREIARMGEE